MPKNTSQGELPIIYFDGIDPLNPVLSVCVYAGSSSGSSWRDGSNQPGLQDADRILSSIAPSGIRNPIGWIKELFVQDISPTRRRMKFAIDATAIQNHVPKYGSTDTLGCDVNPSLCWKGLKFGPYQGDSHNPPGNCIGIWMHPFADLSSSYYDSTTALVRDRIGFLSRGDFGSRKHGWFDSGSRYPMVQEVHPFCEKGHVEFEATEGVEFSYQVTAYDVAGGGPTVAYSGFPLTMNFDPVAGSTLQNGDTISYKWILLESDVGIKYDVKTLLIDTWGTRGGCDFSVVTKPNGAPEGEFVGDLDSLPYLSSRVTKTLNLEVKDDGIPNNSLSYSWSTDCPNATLSNNGGTIKGSSGIITTDVTLDAETNSLPSACTVTATVSDGLKSKQVVAQITVAQCVKDCDGTINGKAQFDICNVCEGDGTSCLDCKGEPFGSVREDRCGVCGGNGESCLECEPYDVSDILAKLDGRANSQRRLVSRIANFIRKAELSSTESKRIASVAVVEAKKLEILQWQSFWIGCGASGRVCQNANFCVTSSNLDLLDLMVSNSDSFRRLTKRLITRTKRDGVASIARRLKWSRLNNKMHRANIAEIGSLPKAKSFC